MTTDITELLPDESSSAPANPEVLIEVMYDRLRDLARARMEHPEHVLQPTALVHEAYMKLVDNTRVDWRGRTHFFAVAAMTMRRVLIDHARAAGRDKRGGSWQRVHMDDAYLLAEDDVLDLIDLHDALNALREVDERMTQVAECRLFAGLSVQETASALDLSERTVHREWKVAKAWLRKRLSEDTDE